MKSEFQIYSKNKKIKFIGNFKNKSKKIKIFNLKVIQKIKKLNLLVKIKN